MRAASRRSKRWRNNALSTEGHIQGAAQIPPAPDHIPVCAGRTVHRCGRAVLCSSAVHRIRPERRDAAASVYADRADAAAGGGSPLPRVRAHRRAGHLRGAGLFGRGSRRLGDALPDAGAVHPVFRRLERDEARRRDLERGRRRLFRGRAGAEGQERKARLGFGLRARRRLRHSRNDGLRRDDRLPARAGAYLRCADQLLCG